METTQESLKATAGKRPFLPWVKIPFGVGVGSLALLLATAFWSECGFLVWPGLAGLVTALLYFPLQCIVRLFQRQWLGALFALLRLVALVFLAFLALSASVTISFLGPSEDHFADNLTIPEGIEIAEPVPDASDPMGMFPIAGTDELQAAVHAALATPGGNVVEFVPAIPSLRRAATDHAKAFRDYIEASPDWHVFIEQGNHFAARRWSYGGEPQNTLHGYISEFGGGAGFQTRCLLCLDCKQWSGYPVQHVQEGTEPVKPKMSRENDLDESQVMIECGGVWVEIFEQSGTPERRVTKATVAVLEREFAEFEKDPQAAIARAQAQSLDLAKRLSGDDGQPFRLLEGMQPGIYGVAYSLNPGEPGSVYLKAFEVTQGTPLSVGSLAESSKTRMTWSANPTEKFGAKAGFTIYEGDWGRPYAARFEVWFKPDSGEPERKLAERIFKIEGWQR